MIRSDFDPAGGLAGACSPAGMVGHSGRAGANGRTATSRASGRRHRLPRSRAFRSRAAIWPRGMRACPATRRRPRSTTASRCAAIRAIRSCSAAPSRRCCRTAKSTRRCGWRNGCCRSTRATAWPASCLACRRSSRSNIRPRASSSRSRCAVRSRTWRRRCSRPGPRSVPMKARPRSRPSTSSPGRNPTICLKDLHAGLILDQSGHRRDALKRLERAYKYDATVLRVAQAYGSQLSRLGNRDEALKVFKALDEALPRHPLVMDALKRDRSRAAGRAAGRHRAGRRRRGALHHRCGARAARRGGRPRLSAARALSQSEPCAGADLARRHL